MRIAYVCADRGIPVFGEKGASVHIREMLRAFGRIGHEVRTLAARRGEGHLCGLPVEAVAPATAPGATRAEKERAAMAQAEAIEARLVALHAEWPFAMIYERYSLWSAAGVRAARRLGLPVVVEVNAPLRREQAEFRSLACAAEAERIEGEVIGGATALAAVSGEIADWLRASGAPSARVQVIGNAVDTRRFHPGVAAAVLPGVPADAFVVGFTGSLKAWHGVEVLLEAFRRFRADVPHAHLLIAGDGPMRGWIEGFAAGAGLAGAVTLAGWVDHAALPALIARMDVATAPYPASEGHYFSPLKLYEYLATGRPVVASAIGQTAELLAASEAAILTPPGDAGALAGALARLARDPASRRRMSAAAAAEGARHDWTDNARAVLRLVRRESAAA